MDLDTALALIPDDEPRARAALQALWSASERQRDAAGAWQAAIGMLLAINFNFVDFRGSSTWCARFVAGLSAAREAGLAEQARRGEPAALRGCTGMADAGSRRADQL